MFATDGLVDVVHPILRVAGWILLAGAGFVLIFAAVMLVLVGLAALLRRGRGVNDDEM